MGMNSAAPMSSVDERALTTDLGARLRELRTARGWSLAALSETTGISVAMLSHIERGQTTPSLRTLERLRTAFAIPLAQLFAEPGRAAGTSVRIVMRQHERQHMELADIGLTKALLSPRRTSSLELLELTIQPRGGSGPEPWVRNGEKAGVVLEGIFVLEVGDERHVLKAQDSFHFDGSKPHRFSNPSDDATRVLWVISSDVPG